MTATAAKLAPVPPAIKLSHGKRSQLVAEHLILLALGKACYKRSDALLEAVLMLPRRKDSKFKLTRRTLGKKVVSNTLRDALRLIAATLENKSFAVRDKFADRNSIPVGQNARRYELEEVSAASRF